MLEFPPLESQSQSFEDAKENQDDPSSSVFLGQRQKPGDVEIVEGFTHTALLVLTATLRPMSRF